MDSTSNARNSRLSLRAPFSMFRLPRRGDKGSIMLEAIVSLALLSTLTLGYATSSISATETERKAINTAIASQVTQDAFETARAAPWALVGTSEIPLAGILPTGVEYVTGSLDNTRTVTSRGLEVTVDTAVRWKENTSSSEYGTKLVTVRVSYVDSVKDTAKRERTETLLLTPGIGEAAPSGVRSAAQGSVPKPPDMPVISKTMIGGPALRVSWPAVESATSYLVEFKLNGDDWTSIQTTGLNHTVSAGWGQLVQARVRASSPAGISLYSNEVSEVMR